MFLTLLQLLIGLLLFFYHFRYKLSIPCILVPYQPNPVHITIARGKTYLLLQQLDAGENALITVVCINQGSIGFSM